jgi:hypothetical protein
MCAGLCCLWDPGARTCFADSTQFRGLKSWLVGGREWEGATGLPGNPIVWRVSFSNYQLQSAPCVRGQVARHRAWREGKLSTHHTLLVRVPPRSPRPVRCGRKEGAPLRALPSPPGQNAPGQGLVLSVPGLGRPAWFVWKHPCRQ